LPLTIWLTLQFLALLLPVLQVPLSDEFPRPIERFALHEMLAVQICFAALLFPLLFRSGASALCTLAASWPFIFLAGFLASVPTARILICGAYLSCWLAFLGCWRLILRSARSQLIAIAVASVLAFAGPLLGYLQAEFSEQTPPGPLSTALDMTPLLTAWQLTDPRTRPSESSLWAPVLIGLSLSTMLAIAVRLKNRRAQRPKNC
jgi:hypothetical protein